MYILPQQKSVENWTKDSNRHFSKEDKGPMDTLKDAYHYYPLRKHKSKPDFTGYHFTSTKVAIIKKMRQ